MLCVGHTRKLLANFLVSFHSGGDALIERNQNHFEGIMELNLRVYDKSHGHIDRVLQLLLHVIVDSECRLVINECCMIVVWPQIL
jgi:hypothetical protein